MNGFLEVVRTARLTMSDDELNDAIQLLAKEKETRRERAFAINKGSMRAGDTVSFINNDGVRVLGEVKKVKLKNEPVKIDPVGYGKNIQKEFFLISRHASCPGIGVSLHLNGP